MTKKYEFLSHTADVKFKVYGSSLDELFSNAISAFSEIVSRGKRVGDGKKKKIKISGKDNEELLYQMLDELIYQIDANGFLVKAGKVKVKDGMAVGELVGDSSEKYEGLESVKAATYAEMYVKEVENGWEGQVVLDV